AMMARTMEPIIQKMMGGVLGGMLSRGGGGGQQPLQLPAAPVEGAWPHTVE
ncbi:unnamed protein product, partial [marine sediment metagenome]